MEGARSFKSCQLFKTVKTPVWRFCLDIYVIFQAFAALYRAWYLQSRHGSGSLVLAAVQSRRIFSNVTETTGRIVDRVDHIQRLVVFRSKHQCFYRAYARAVVLRKCGVPVVLNLGLVNLGAGKQVEGHCWLTLNGRDFFEKSGVRHLYQHKLAQTDGDVCYWVGAERSLRQTRRSNKHVASLA